MFILFVVGEKDFSNIVSIDWHSQNFRVRIIWHQHNPFYAFEQHDFLCTRALFLHAAYLNSFYTRAYTG